MVEMNEFIRLIYQILINTEQLHDLWPLFHSKRLQDFFRLLKTVD